MKFYLASTSPARLALLRSSGIEPVLLPSNVDEDAVAEAREEQLGHPLTPHDYVLLLARAKAEAVVLQASGHEGATETHEDATATNIIAGTSTSTNTSSGTSTDTDTNPSAATAPTINGLVLGGDSSFVVDGVIYGKPHTAENARARWQAQRGKTGTLFSGHWLIDVRNGEVHSAVGSVTSAEVTFSADITDDEIDAYVATGEPLHVAGAFTIDSMGAPFIDRIVGEPSTVVGLSLPALRRLVRELGHEWQSLWNRKP